MRNRSYILNIPRNAQPCRFFVYSSCDIVIEGKGNRELKRKIGNYPSKPQKNVGNDC